MKHIMTNTSHSKDKYFQLKSPGKIQLQGSHRREKKWRSKMMTITVTRHVGPDFKVYLPDDVSLIFFFLLFVAMMTSSKIHMTKY